MAENETFSEPCYNGTKSDHRIRIAHLEARLRSKEEENENLKKLLAFEREEFRSLTLSFGQCRCEIASLEQQVMRQKDENFKFLNTHIRTAEVKENVHHCSKEDSQVLRI